MNNIGHTDVRDPERQVEGVTDPLTAQELEIG